MSYRVELTPPAEEAYYQFHRRAQAELDAGRPKHPAVLTFEEIQRILESVLTTNPCDPACLLMGPFADKYKVSIKRVSICYDVRQEAVIVRAISPVEPLNRQMLLKAIASGNLDTLLDSYKIEKPGCKVGQTSALVN
ncbi:MAG TPA: hypothetical protein VI306_09815 [Pyrinomonadaceae bacterium]